jgi:hypothetical protein
MLPSPGRRGGADAGVRTHTLDLFTACSMTVDETTSESAFRGVMVITGR